MVKKVQQGFNRYVVADLVMKIGYEMQFMKSLSKVLQTSFPNF